MGQKTHVCPASFSSAASFLLRISFIQFNLFYVPVWDFRGKKSSIFLTRIFSVGAFLQARLVEIKFFSWPAERAVSTQQACGQLPAGTVCQELLQLKTNHPTAAQR